MFLLKYSACKFLTSNKALTNIGHFIGKIYIVQLATFTLEDQNNKVKVQGHLKFHEILTLNNFSLFKMVYKNSSMDVIVYIKWKWNLFSPHLKTITDCVLLFSFMCWKWRLGPTDQTFNFRLLLIWCMQMYIHMPL